MTSLSATIWSLPAIVHVLRDATREAHERLDSQSPMAASHIDLATYHDILTRYLEAHAAVESALEPWASELSRMGVALDVRRKVPLLVRDLTVTASRLARVPDTGAPLTFVLPTLAAAFGALYVVEGSTLGGQHILKGLTNTDLVRANCLGADAGLAYFNGYGAETAVMWRNFLTALGNADAADPASRDAVIQGAQSTFSLFEHVLSQKHSSIPSA